MRSKYVHGKALPEGLDRIAEEVSDSIGLRRVPPIRMVAGVAMPLVAGVIRPKVLVPDDFADWSTLEQKATLWHELMHIHRRDIIGHAMAKLARSLFWFHPATWLIDRRLMEAREWATDQQVIRWTSSAGGGLNPGQYAESVLNIVARLGMKSTSQQLSNGSAIAMSAFGDMERRLANILEAGNGRSARIAMLAQTSIFSLLLVTLLTTARIELASASEPPKPAPAERKESDTKEAEAQQGTPIEQELIADDEDISVAEPIGEGDHDFVQRIRDSKVLTVRGDDFHSILSVSGRVVSEEGTPVPGAIVVMRESSNWRASAESDRYIYHEERHRLRVPDVIANTISDGEGRFRFRDVKSPPFPKGRSVRWEGHVVAAHPSLGIGWHSLPNAGDSANTVTDHNRIDDVTLTLRPTATVRGRFVTADGAPIRDATVSLIGLARPARYAKKDDRFDCWLSQLSPRTLTNENGEFQFLEIPQGLAAFVNLNHPESVEMTVAIATSGDVPLGKRENDGGWLPNFDILASPARVTADPGRVISGQVVDSNQEPIAGAIVQSGSTLERVTTDKDGRFDLRISNESIERNRDMDRTSMTIHIFTKRESGYLSNPEEVSLDDIEAEKPLTAQLERGVMVSGRVVTEDGQPADQMILHCVGQTSSYATSQSDGRFEMLVAPQRYTLVVGTEQPGYALPKRIDLLRAKSESDYGSWPHVEVDASDGADRELPEIVVTRVAPLHVVAKLPNGKPALGAEVILKDERPEPQQPNLNFAIPPTIVEKSIAVATDAEGRATVMPLGSTSERAYLQIKLTDGNAGYDARVPMPRIDVAPIEVTLRPALIVEGRVLVDGQGVEGAKISVGESKPFTRKTNGVTFTGSTVIDSQTARTDSRGGYHVVVRPDRQYLVSLQGLAEERLSPGVSQTYQPVPTGDGRLRVPDFLCRHGDQAIEGTVVDAAGNPIEDARVTFSSRDRETEPGLWIGHRSESQYETDAQGRFVLANVPPGSYQLSVRPPRIPGQSSSFSTEVTGTAGDHNMKIVLAAAAPRPTPRPTPRLEPRRIQKLTPPSP